MKPEDFVPGPLLGFCKFFPKMEFPVERYPEKRVNNCRIIQKRDAKGKNVYFVIREDWNNHQWAVDTYAEALEWVHAPLSLVASYVWAMSWLGKLHTQEWERQGGRVVRGRFTFGKVDNKEDMR